MYNPIYTANNFIERSFEDNIYISPMKLQKMLYFFYRDYLKRTNEPLFAERFMAWPYGPVLISIYYNFKKYGSRPIDKFVELEGKLFKIKEEIDTNFKDIICEIWNRCRNLDAITLSKITHKENGAWIKAYLHKKPFLEDEDIRNDNIEISTC
ncbi:MAG: DUF4065 domain-containing protein [Endomicrobium sp.]|jgi:uncharacterized phage-associated protein|nr:DUF4065 domain-containing protein [Endomicrobium sp.]